MYICAICGYNKLEYPLWDEKEGYPTHQICSCCGFESGYDDDDIGMSIEQYRNEWIRLGAHWFDSKKSKPSNWDYRLQLLNINVKV